MRSWRAQCPRCRHSALVRPLPISSSDGLGCCARHRPTLRLTSFTVRSRLSDLGCGLTFVTPYALLGGVVRVVAAVELELIVLVLRAANLPADVPEPVLRTLKQCAQVGRPDVGRVRDRGRQRQHRAQCGRQRMGWSGGGRRGCARVASSGGGHEHRPVTTVDPEREKEETALVRAGRRGTSRRAEMLAVGRARLLSELTLAPVSLLRRAGHARGTSQRPKHSIEQHISTLTSCKVTNSSYHGSKKKEIRKACEGRAQTRGHQNDGTNGATKSGSLSPSWSLPTILGVWMNIENRWSCTSGTTGANVNDRTSTNAIALSSSIANRKPTHAPAGQR